MSGGLPYIVDAHHHLWDLGHCHYPWLMAKGVRRFFGDPAPIQKNYLAPDFKAEFGPLPVTKSVHIQVGVDEADAVKETAWVQAQGETHDIAQAIIAFCDITAPEAEDTLDQHSAYAHLRGVRQIVGRSAQEDAKLGTNALLASPAFKAGLAALARRGLVFDLQLTPPLLKSAAQVFVGVPDLKVALCHAGSPSDVSPDGLAQWKAGLAQFARVPQAICKISGFGMFQPQWTVSDIRPLFLTVIDIFGPQRVAFGSNFPVDKLAADYQRVMGAYLEITDSFSCDERTAMFAGTAEGFYGI